MQNPTLNTPNSIDEKVEYYYNLYASQGKTGNNFSKESIKSAIEYLNYKDAPKLNKQESDTEPTLYIFRHGQTNDNAEFLFSGWREATLTEKGNQQALILSDKLKDKKIDVLYASPQIRAIDTMKIAISKNEKARDLPINMDPKIKERCYGDLQGKSKLEVYLTNKEQAEQIRRSYDYIPPNGESIAMVCKRVAEFCEDITKIMREQHINVAVSCHGNSIRGFKRYFEGLSDYEIAHLETPLGQDYESYIIK